MTSTTNQKRPVPGIDRFPFRGEDHPRPSGARPPSRLVNAHPNRPGLWFCSFALCLLLLALDSVAFAGVMYRPGQELRSVTAGSYQLVIQKNGRVNVFLNPSMPVFTNAYPMVWFEGEREPEPLDLAGRDTRRQEVRDRLGAGQGMFFKQDNGEWSLRTYPAKPFMTVQCAYVNTGKEPVRVKMLMPWCVGYPARGQFSLSGPNGETVTLPHASALHTAHAKPLLQQAGGSSLWNLAAWNRQSGRSLIAGFLTNAQSLNSIQFDAEDTQESFDRFRAACYFDPPIEVPPGGRLESEVLYLAIAETGPLEGLERFGWAYAAANELSPNRGSPFRGWQAAVNPDDASNIEQFARDLDTMRDELLPFGFDTVVLEQLRHRTSDEAGPLLTEGLDSFAHEARERGFNTGITGSPFSIQADTPFVREHPEWVAKPAGPHAWELTGNGRVLDMTTPGAAQWLDTRLQDVLQAQAFDFLLPSKPFVPTPAQVFHQDTSSSPFLYTQGALQRLAGGGTDTGTQVLPAPVPMAASLAPSHRISRDPAPVWERPHGIPAPGFKEVAARAASRYYLTPALGAFYTGPAYFGLDATYAALEYDIPAQARLTHAQGSAWLTWLALTGSPLVLGDRPSELAPSQIEALQRLGPALDRPARPVDFLENDPPRIWSLSYTNTPNTWHIAGVFNWETESAQDITLDFHALGMDARRHYTVFDFWDRAYHGVARRSVSVQAGPASHRLLSFRPYHERPMLLAADHRLSQGAQDITGLAWDAANGSLSGTLEAPVPSEFTLYILVPEPYRFEAATCSAELVEAYQDGEVCEVTFQALAGDSVQWEVRFSSSGEAKPESPAANNAQ